MKTAIYTTRVYQNAVYLFFYEVETGEVVRFSAKVDGFLIHSNFEDLNGFLYKFDRLISLESSLDIGLIKTILPFCKRDGIEIIMLAQNANIDYSDAITVNGSKLSIYSLKSILDLDCDIQWCQYFFDLDIIYDNRKAIEYSDSDTIKMIDINLLTLINLYLYSKGLKDSKVNYWERLESIGQETGLNSFKIPIHNIGVGYLKSVYKPTEKQTNTGSEFNCINLFPKYAAVEEKIRNLYDCKFEDLNKSFKIGDVTYNIKNGGIHSVDNLSTYYSSDKDQIITCDVSSQHINTIYKKKIAPYHLDKREKWNELVSNLLAKRIEYKKDGNSLSSTYKNLLVGIYGELKNKNSWMYCEQSYAEIVITSQIDMIMLIQLLQFAGISILSANTDGLTVLCPKDKSVTYGRICEEWEQLVGNKQYGSLSHNYYDVYFRTSVSDYIYISEFEINSGGRFSLNKKICDNKSFQIIPKAIVEHLKGKDYKEFIMKSKDLFDFCGGFKAKDYDFVTKELKKGKTIEVKRDPTVRYLISDTGVTLYRKTNSKYAEVHKGYKVELDELNLSNVNKDFYLKEVEKTIKNMDNNQTLF